MIYIYLCNILLNLNYSQIRRNRNYIKQTPLTDMEEINLQMYVNGTRI